MKPKTNLVHLVLAAFLAGTGCGDSAAFQGGSGGQPGVGGEPVVGTGGAAGEVGTGGSAVRCPVGFAGDDCDECAPLFQDNDADGTCKLACGDLVQCGSGACDDASGTAVCSCDEGYVGESCDECASGFIDPVGNGSCTRIDADVPEGGAVAFVTSNTFGAAFGDATGADAKCQESADAVGLDRTFAAFVARESGPASAEPFSTSGPWYRLDGLKVVDAIAWDTSSQIFNGFINRLNLSETFEEVPSNSRTWVGFLRPSSGSGIKNCFDWESVDPSARAGAGETDDRRFWWFSDLTVRCDQRYRLYCFEVR